MIWGSRSGRSTKPVRGFYNVCVRNSKSCWSKFALSNHNLANSQKFFFNGCPIAALYRVGTRNRPRSASTRTNRTNDEKLHPRFRFGQLHAGKTRRSQAYTNRRSYRWLRSLPGYSRWICRQRRHVHANAASPRWRTPFCRRTSVKPRSQAAGRFLPIAKLRGSVPGKSQRFPIRSAPTPFNSSSAAAAWERSFERFTRN